MKYQGPPPPPITDKEAVYDEQISPLMIQIIAICKQNGIPVFASFVYAPDNFCTTHIPAPAESEEGRRLVECERAVTRSRDFAAFMITTIPAHATSPPSAPTEPEEPR
jgi:hypothetical protein